MVHSEVGHCQWNSQCDQMQRYTHYTVEMHGAISIAVIPVSVLFEETSDNQAQVD